MKYIQITDMSTSLATWLKSLPSLLSTLSENGEHATVIMGGFEIEYKRSLLLILFHFSHFK